MSHVRRSRAGQLQSTPSVGRRKIHIFTEGEKTEVQYVGHRCDLRVTALRVLNALVAADRWERRGTRRGSHYVLPGSPDPEL